jgi:hypothetical protein
MSNTDLTDETKITKLIRTNRILSIVHLLQGIAIIVLSTSAKFSVTQAYQKFNPKTEMLEAATRPLFSIQLSLAVAVFFFVSAFAHFYVGWLRPKWYSDNLARGINKARWYEYGISASIMMVAIAILAGMEDLTAIILIFALTFVMNMMGLVMESHNKVDDVKPNWFSFNIGSIAGAIPWIVIAIYFWAAETASTGANGSVPTFVYIIFITIFAFFNCFAINMILQYKRVGKWKDYLYGERVYMILSLVAKSLLAWQIFFGTLRP